MSVRLETGGMPYGPEEVEDLRNHIIQLRDAALKQGAMEWAVVLSHTIGLMFEMRKHIWPETVTPKEKRR